MFKSEQNRARDSERLIPNLCCSHLREHQSVSPTPLLPLHPLQLPYVTEPSSHTVTKTNSAPHILIMAVPYGTILYKTSKIKSHSNGKIFTCMTKVNCKSSNLIYVIMCKTCGIQYVGQTKNRLLTRFQGHFNDIAHDRDTTVARHLNSCTSTESNNTTTTRKFDISITSFITSIFCVCHLI